MNDNAIAYFDSMSDADLQNTDAFVSLTGNDELNVVAAMYAASLHIPKVISRLSSSSKLKILQKDDRITTVSQEDTAVNLILGYARSLMNAEAHDAVEALYRLMDGRLEFIEFPHHRSLPPSQPAHPGVAHQGRHPAGPHPARRQAHRPPGRRRHPPRRPGAGGDDAETADPAGGHLPLPEGGGQRTMNKRSVLNILGKIVLTEVCLMIPSLLVSLYYGDGDWIYFVVTMIPAALLGAALSRVKPREAKLTSRDGYCIVAYGWILISLIGAVPLYLTDQFTSYFQALFEIVSGFTTTAPPSWPSRSCCPTASSSGAASPTGSGGMGVLVFVLMIIPMKNDNSMHLVRAEVPGPIAGKLVPRMKRTSMILYGIYTAMTVLLVILLLLGGVKLFDSLCLAFGAAGTGGFAVSSAGIAGYGSAYVEIVLGIFMILFGINFNIYYLILVGRIRDALGSEEVRCFLGIIAVATIAITINIFSLVSSLGEALRHAFFQVSSIITTTGFATVDFNLWPEFSKHTLVPFNGHRRLRRLHRRRPQGLPGHHPGQVLLAEIRYIVSPKSVQTVRLEHKYVDKVTLNSTRTYAAAYMMLVALSTLILSLDGYNLITNLTAVLSCINNIGPGLDLVGPHGQLRYLLRLGHGAAVHGHAHRAAGNLPDLPAVLPLGPTGNKHKKPYFWSKPEIRLFCRAYCWAARCAAGGGRSPGTPAWPPSSRSRPSCRALRRYFQSSSGPARRKAPRGCPQPGAASWARRRGG